LLWKSPGKRKLFAQNRTPSTHWKRHLSTTWRGEGPGLRGTAGGIRRLSSTLKPSTGPSGGLGGPGDFAFARPLLKIHDAGYSYHCKRFSAGGWMTILEPSVGRARPGTHGNPVHPCRFTCHSSHLTTGRTWVACRRQIIATWLSEAAPRWRQGRDVRCCRRPLFTFGRWQIKHNAAEPGARRGLGFVTVSAQYSFVNYWLVIWCQPAPNPQCPEPIGPKSCR
jgi:hypothetical protein